MPKSPAKERVEIPKDLAAQVLFASDRTCCVCRREREHIQIHHIDSNPANNTFENLCVLCLNCHSLAHSELAFARGLTKEAVALYSSSWRAQAGVRLHPPPEGSGRYELVSEAFLECSLDCHQWKALFMSLLIPNVPDGREGEFSDVWDLMEARWIPEHSPPNIERFRVLFAQGINQVRSRFDRLLQIYTPVLPWDFLAQIVRANRHLEVQQFAYTMGASRSPVTGSGEVAAATYRYCFLEVIQVLRDISRDADRRRSALPPSLS